MSYDIGVKRVAIVEGGLTQDTQMPVNISYRESTAVNTHNAVSVALSSFSDSTAWVDCSGYSDVGITFLNSAASNGSANILWSNDANTIHGADFNIIVNDTNTYKAASTKVKARYAKVRIINGDASNARTMSSWLYLMS
jgi:hypothetical protein